MSTPRRRLVRSAPVSLPSNPQHERRRQRLRDRLEHERATLTRWQRRLKRALNAVAKFQKSIGRLEHQLAKQEE